MLLSNASAARWVGRDEFYGVSKTDQAGSRRQDGRTIDGLPVEYAGTWWPIQFEYRPFKKAVKQAAQRAYKRCHPLIRLAEIAEKGARLT